MRGWWQDDCADNLLHTSIHIACNTFSIACLTVLKYTSLWWLFISFSSPSNIVQLIDLTHMMEALHVYQPKLKLLLTILGTYFQECPVCHGELKAVEWGGEDVNLRKLQMKMNMFWQDHLFNLREIVLLPLEFILKISTSLTQSFNSSRMSCVC